MKEEVTAEAKQKLIDEAVKVASQALMMAMKVTGYENFITCDMYTEPNQQGDKYTLTFVRNDFKIPE